MNLVDPVSSLRAAALLTRNFKRRKTSGDSEPTQSTQVYQLKDELPLASFEKNAEQNSISEILDKEEGEISEEEGQLPLHDLRSSSPSSQASLLSCSTPSAPSETFPSSQQNLLQARPNLQMTDEQLWEAKVVVLDLLGWGVPPSYLIDFGLSRETVYYVFTELQLKLPDNFFNDNTSKTMQNAVFLDDNPSLSFKTKQESVSESQHAPALLEMEQMKRKELLARKAVLDSRKQKLSAKTNSASATPNHSMDTVSSPEVTQTSGQVDMFLQSINPVEAIARAGSWARRDEHLECISKDLRKGPQGSFIGSNPAERIETGLRAGKRPVAADFVDVFDNEQLTESTNIGMTLPTDYLGDESVLRESTSMGFSHPTTIRNGGPTFNKVSVIRKCVIDCSDDEDDTTDEGILSDIALVKSKEEEIRRLRERIERYKTRQVFENGIEDVGEQAFLHVERNEGGGDYATGMQVDDGQIGGQFDSLSISDADMAGPRRYVDDGMADGVARHKML